MARDYKRAATKKKTPKTPLPGWLLFVAGLSIGLFGTLLVYLQSQSANTSANSLLNSMVTQNADHKDKEKQQSAMPPTTPVVDIDADVTSDHASKEPAKKDEKPENTRPRFEFYTILPELEVLIPDEEIKKKRQKPIEKRAVENGTLKNNSSASRSVIKNKPIKDQGVFVLQAGSFKGFDQADRRKAKLALLGATAKIQRVTIYENEVWYRVRIGPFNDLKKLNNVRVLLNKNNINAIPLKVKSKNK